MSRIRGQGNKDTELVLAKLFRKHNISGWRRHQKIIGKPDFIFRKAKLAVFVDGCFWHCCPRHGTKPKSNRTFWLKKLYRNQSRDRQVNRTLRKMGWRVIRLWECALHQQPERCLARVHRALASFAVQLRAAGC